MAYQSGELTPEDRAIFDAHLAICPWCVAYLKNYEETILFGKGALAEPEAPVPAAVPDALVKAILAARRKRP